MLADEGIGSIPASCAGLYDEFALIGPPAHLYRHYRLDATGSRAAPGHFLPDTAPRREDPMTDADARAPGAYDGRGRDSPQWWPSRYSTEDELGAGNELTPERAMAAFRSRRRAALIQLAQLLEPGIPAYPPRALAPADPRARPAGGRLC